MNTIGCACVCVKIYKFISSDMREYKVIGDMFMLAQVTVLAYTGQAIHMLGHYPEDSLCISF